jgi:membrane-bound serine protease (ClpP class)
VIVYVAPSGARAASAGMFVTLAAHVAAMAPGTNVGAAHPVALGARTDEVMAEKALSDAAALARALAEQRGRNAAWAERAVRESASITADEAVRERVIDLVAADLGQLLRQVDGRSVVTVAGETVLATSDAAITEMPMTWGERILHVIADPNIAFLLLNLGILGILIELFHPGTVAPGVVGTTALLLAFAALGVLPTNWAGLMLIALSVVVVVVDLKVGGAGVLSLGALATFILGSLLLFAPFEAPSPSMPRVAVSPWLVALVTMTIGTFVAVVLRAVVRAQRAPVVTGIEALVGRHGVVVSALAPEGTVLIEGELWTAVVENGPLAPGAEVQVVRVEGVTLHVVSR